MEEWLKITTFVNSNLKFKTNPVLCHDIYVYLF